MRRGKEQQQQTSIFVLSPASEISLENGMEVTENKETQQKFHLLFFFVASKDVKIPLAQTQHCEKKFRLPATQESQRGIAFKS